jgi:hypothetical protein
MLSLGSELGTSLIFPSQLHFSHLLGTKQGTQISENKIEFLNYMKNISLKQNTFHNATKILVKEFTWF